MTCQKCVCPECSGAGWIGQQVCWQCVDLSHTCIVWLGAQRDRQEVAATKPYSPPELMALAESYGRSGKVPYVVCRLLATIKELNDTVDKMSGVRKEV